MNKLLMKFIIMLLAIAGVSACQMEKDEPWFELLRDDSFEQVDRLGFPLMKKMFMNYPEIITEIKTGDPSTDEEDLSPLIEAAVTEIRGQLDGVDGLEALSDSASTGAEVAAMMSPHILSVDLTEEVTASTRNGLRFEGDDVFDSVFKLVSGRATLDDEVDEPESVAYSVNFPYLALIHTELEAPPKEEEEEEEEEEDEDVESSLIKNVSN